MQYRQSHPHVMNKLLRVASMPVFESIVTDRVIILLCPVQNNNRDYLTILLFIYPILLDNRSIRLLRICVRPSNIC